MFLFFEIEAVYFNNVIEYDEHTEISIKWSHCLYVQSKYWIQMDQNQWPSVSYRWSQIKFQNIFVQESWNHICYPAIANCDVKSNPPF